MKLTSEQKTLLTKCCKQIKNSLEKVRATDLYGAILTLEREKLYAPTHTSLQLFLQERFGISERNAKYFIAEAHCISDIGEDVQSIASKFETRSAVREVSKAPQGKRREVFEKAVSIASKRQSIAISKIDATKADSLIVRPARADADIKESYCDEAGVEIPVALWPEWKNRKVYGELSQKVMRSDLFGIADELDKINERDLAEHLRRTVRALSIKISEAKPAFYRNGVLVRRG